MNDPSELKPTLQALCKKDQSRLAKSKELARLLQKDDWSQTLIQNLRAEGDEIMKSVNLEVQEREAALVHKLAIAVGKIEELKAIAVNHG